MSQIWKVGKIIHSVQGAIMRFSDMILVVAIIAGAVYWGHGYYRTQQQTIQELQAQVRTLQAQLEQKDGSKAEQSPVGRADSSSAQASTIDKQVMCPACGGEGQLMLRSTIASKTGSARYVGGRDTPYACPICGSKGYIIIMHMPVNATVCPDCLGMSKRPYSPKLQDYVACGTAKESTVRLIARPCKRCGGRGYLLVPR